MLSRVKDFFSIPLYQGFTFLLIIFGIYFAFLTSNQRLIDIEIQDNLAFLAQGEAGVFIVDITDPRNIIEIGSYDTLAPSNRIAIKGSNIYVANGSMGLLVLGYSDPANIKYSGSFNTTGFTEDVALDKNHAYLADGSNGLVILKIDDLNNIHPLQGQEKYTPPGYLQRIIIHNKRAYIADRNGRVRIVNISNPKSPNEVGVIEAGALVNDIAIVDNKAYLAASGKGIVVFNIDDPNQPVEIGTYNSPGIAQALSVGGLHAYLADGSGGLRYIDLTHPDQMAEIGKFENPGNAVDLVVEGSLVYLADASEGLKVVELDYSIESEMLTPDSQSGNSVDVALSNGIAYMANQSNGIQMISVSNPLLPKEVGLYDTPGSANAVVVADNLVLVADKNEGLRVLSPSSSSQEKIVLTEKSFLKRPGQSLDLATNGNYIYLANGNGGLRVIDVSNPDEPREVGAEERISNASSVAVLDSYAYVADSPYGLRVVSIGDPAIPAEVGDHETPGEALRVSVIKVEQPSPRILVFVADGEAGLRVIDATDPRNPHEVGFNDEPDFVKDISIENNLAYVADTTDGLWVMNISDPINPVEIGFYNSPGEAYAVDNAGQYVYLADFDRGLRVVEVSNPALPMEVGYYDQPKHIVDIQVEDLAYLVDQNRGLQVMDVSNPEAPTEIGFYDANGTAKGLAVDGEQAYMGVVDNLKVIGISEPEKPVELSSFGIPSVVTAVDVSKNHAFVTNGESGLRIVNVQNPTDPQSSGTFPARGNALDVYVRGDYAYTAEAGGGVQAIYVKNPDTPNPTSFVDDFMDAQAVLLVGDYLYVANGDQGLGVINVNKPPDPEVITSQDTPGTAMGLAAAEQHLFVADRSGGIQVMYIFNPADPIPVGTLDVPGGSVAIDVVPQKLAENEPSHFYVYSAGTNPGLQIIDARKTAQFLAIGFFPSPVTYGLMLFHLLVFSLSLGIWVFLSSQLVFPVENWRDRWTTMGRILRFGTSLLGPGLLIREGKVVSASDSPASNGSTIELGKGFVMVDLSSAAVLTRLRRSYPLPFRFFAGLISRFWRIVDRSDDMLEQRVVGPGAYFTQLNVNFTETVQEIVDLRRQFRRRREVYGFTRDGIEVKTRISCNFSIGELPDTLQVTYVGGRSPENLRVIYHDGKVITNLTKELDRDDRKEINGAIEEWEKHNLHPMSRDVSIPDPSPQNPFESNPYDFDEQRVINALYPQTHDVNEDTHMHWTELPVHVAVEVFREILMQQVYDNLYFPNKPGEFPLEAFRRNFTSRMRSQGILSFQIVIRYDNKDLKPGDRWDQKILLFSEVQDLQNTAKKILRSRGIKIRNAGFSVLDAVSEVVQEKRYDFWSAQWEREGIATEAFYEREALRARNFGRTMAQSEMVKYFAEILNSDSYTSEAMVLRVLQAIESAGADPATSALLPDETIEMLLELRRLFLPPGGSEPDIDIIEGGESI